MQNSGERKDHRVALFCSSPKSERNINRIDQERTILQQRSASAKRRFEIANTKNHVTSFGFEEHVEDLCRTSESLVIHISGHCNNGVICFVDENDNPYELNTKQFAHIIKENNKNGAIHGVVLNCSDTEQLAEALVNGKVVEFAIGVNGKLTDQDSIHFTATFYRHLYNEEDPRSAFITAVGGMAKREQITLYTRHGKLSGAEDSVKEEPILKVVVPSGDTTEIPKPPTITKPEPKPSHSDMLPNVDYFTSERFRKRDRKDELIWVNLLRSLDELLGGQVLLLKNAIPGIRATEWEDFPKPIAISCALNLIRNRDHTLFKIFYDSVAHFSEEAKKTIDSSPYGRIFNPI